MPMLPKFGNKKCPFGESKMPQFTFWFAPNAPMGLPWPKYAKFAYLGVHKWPFGGSKKPKYFVVSKCLGVSPWPKCAYLAVKNAHFGGQKCKHMPPPKCLLQIHPRVMTKICKICIYLEGQKCPFGEGVSNDQHLHYFRGQTICPCCY